ncbi:MAG TPA: cellulose synthase catalytic subunit [Streptosporangiaceae bacterium]|nr:cellulose synthase catalytic subunit [Streptosporangiaceae bacterium]
MTAPPLTARGKHHRRVGVVVPEPPDDHERASYGWRSLPFLAVALAVSALCIIGSQLWMEISHPILAIFCWYTLVYTAYQLLSLPVNFGGRGFDLTGHVLRVKSWRPASWPNIDIYLPICGEPIEVLRNTWAGVFEMVHAYQGVACAFVLDDGPSDEAARMSESFGFSYLRRPNTRQYKKAGNLNYAFGRTSAPLLVVFDADFRPRPDFLAETLPYLDDPTIGIVQTPQFFRVSPGQTWVERAAGPTLEIFYRVVQVARDRLGSALCVGSNAVYRRAALAPSGGFTLIPYAEDSHSGLDARLAGYRLKYLPVPLAAGICPATLDAFMRQQYRWCCGATSLIWTRHMWRVPMPRMSRLPYVAGWLWNLTTALRTLTLPLIPIVLLAYLPGEIRLRNALPLVPVVLVTAVLYPLWHNSPYSPRIWPLSLAVGWAQVLAIWDFARGRVMSWTPTRQPGDATRRFWYGVTIWNGGLALIWMALAAWRIVQTGSPRFAVVAVLGLVNLVIVGRLIFPGRSTT